jgi:DNA-binding PadR family transcriptional regulator
MASKQETPAAPAELSGREIARLYEQATDETITYGMVYSALAELEDAGRVRSRHDDHEGRPTRWYRLTEEGLDAVRRGPSPAESAHDPASPRPLASDPQQLSKPDRL